MVITSDGRIFDTTSDAAPTETGKPGNASWSEKNKVIADLDMSKRTLSFIVDGKRQPITIFGLPGLLSIGVCSSDLSRSCSVLLFHPSLFFTFFHNVFRLISLKLVLQPVVPKARLRVCSLQNRNPLMFSGMVGRFLLPTGKTPK